MVAGVVGLKSLRVNIMGTAEKYLSSSKKWLFSTVARTDRNTKTKFSVSSFLISHIKGMFSLGKEVIISFHSLLLLFFLVLMSTLAIPFSFLKTCYTSLSPKFLKAYHPTLSWFPIQSSATTSCQASLLQA